MLEAAQLSAETGMPFHQECFGLRGDRVGHQPAAGRQPVDTRLHQVAAGKATADEDDVGLPGTVEVLRCRTPNLDIGAE